MDCERACCHCERPWAPGGAGLRRSDVKRFPRFSQPLLRSRLCRRACVAGAWLLTPQGVAEADVGGSLSPTALNANGSNSIEYRVADGVYDPKTGDFNWSRSPLTIVNPANGATIAMPCRESLHHQRSANRACARSGWASITQFDVHRLS